jgi:hypothetical protein
MPNQTQSLGDYAESAAQQLQQLGREIVVDDHHITFAFTESGNYRIELSRIKTAEQLLSWVQHLAAKTWMTPQRLKYFIGKVVEKSDIRLPSL